MFALTGNLDWLGNEFIFNAGVGLVISQPEGVEERNGTVVEQLRAAFERDWFSNYTRSLRVNKAPICNKHQINKMVPVKANLLQTGPMHIRTGRLDNGPAPGRNIHKDDGKRALKMRHHDNRQNKMNHQDVANGLGQIIDTYQEQGRVKMSRLDNRQVQITENYSENHMDPSGQLAESSGSRSLWPRPTASALPVETDFICKTCLRALRRALQSGTWTALWTKHFLLLNFSLSLQPFKSGNDACSSAEMDRTQRSFMFVFDQIILILHIDESVCILIAGTKLNQNVSGKMCSRTRKRTRSYHLS